MSRRGRPNRSGIDWSDPAAHAQYKRQSQRHQEYNQTYHQDHKDQWRKRATKRRERLKALRGGIRRVARFASRLFWRRPRGEQHYRTTLTESDVREIRRRYAAGELQTTIGADFGLTKNAISKIVNRKTWKHVED